VQTAEQQLIERDIHSFRMSGKAKDGLRWSGPQEISKTQRGIHKTCEKELSCNLL
jgi:hypothetical protein